VMSFPRLRGKIVLITGASSGIGESSARVFAHSGAHLILGARRLDRLTSLKEEIENKSKVQVHIGELDVTKIQSIEAFLKNIPSSLSAIDILVNNAGLALGMDFTHQTTPDQVDVVIDTNVKGVMFMIQAVVPGMVSRGNGHIINVSSIAAHEAYKGGSIYCASKHAVRAITTSLRKELFDTPIRVSAISPGLVKTEFSRVRYSGDEDRSRKAYEGLPEGPLLPEDIAEEIAFAACRPKRVQMAEIISLANNQGSTEFIFRK